jgi:SPP1 family predicted phage head-tail adaptor
MLGNVRIAEMDRKITIQSKVKTTNEYNEDRESWEDFKTLHASVKNFDGSENYQADKLTATQVTVFTIRYRTDLTKEMRVSYNDENYDIVSIKEPNGFRRTLLEIRAFATE